MGMFPRPYSFHPSQQQGATVAPNFTLLLSDPADDDREVLCLPPFTVPELI